MLQGQEALAVGHRMIVRVVFMASRRGVAMIVVVVIVMHHVDQSGMLHKHVGRRWKPEGYQQPHHELSEPTHSARLGRSDRGIKADLSIIDVASAQLQRIESTLAPGRFFDVTEETFRRVPTYQNGVPHGDTPTGQRANANQSEATDLTASSPLQRITGGAGGEGHDEGDRLIPPTVGSATLQHVPS